MKKLVLILSIVTLGFCSANAQTSLLANLTSDQGVHKAGLDTTSGTVGVTQIVQIPGSWVSVTIQARVSKLTGAPGGSLKCYGSTDGVGYDFVSTSIDSLAVANVSTLQVKTWKITGNPYQYYKLIYKPTGTQTSTIVTKALARK